MSRSGSGKAGNERPEARVSRVMKLRALLAISMDRSAQKDFDEEPYAELLNRSSDQLMKLGKTAGINLIRKKLAGLPNLSQDQLLAPYPQLITIGEQLSFTKTEQLVLLLLVSIHQHRDWQDIFSLADPLTPHKVRKYFSRIIQAREADVDRALKPSGNLVRSGLIKSENEYLTSGVCSAYEVMDGLDEDVLQQQDAWNSLLDHFFGCNFNGSLTIRDFGHLVTFVNTGLQVLEGALAHKSRGVHILLHGPPGSGKTELAWAWSRHLKSKVLSASTRGKDGIEKSGIERLRGYALGQRLFRDSAATLFIFDEMEDVFHDDMHYLFGWHRGTGNKGFINEELENAKVPTIWTANNIDNVDPAHLRRFTCIFEIPLPPRSVRRKLLSTAMHGRDVSQTWIARAAECPALSPAEIASLASSLEITGSRGREAEAMMEQVLREKLCALGHSAVIPIRQPDPIEYNPDWLNINTAPRALPAGIRQQGRAAILFYGPPGTGKSALAKYLSEALDRPILTQRASDLLDPYLGMTERQIADAFRSAHREDAILFVDEADSFLRSRESAARSWEVTQVNEMLVQMENFEGVFIAATNLIDDLDPASFRRFDMKIRFESLDPEQRWQVFLSLLEEKSQDPDGLRELYRGRLAQLDSLTLGDFRAALRSIQIRQTKVTAALLYEALREECRYKNPGRVNKRPVGFVTH